GRPTGPWPPSGPTRTPPAPRRAPPPGGDTPQPASRMQHAARRQRGSEAPARRPAQIRGHLVAEQTSRITHHPELEARRRGCRAVPGAVADVVPARLPVLAVAAGVAFGAAELLGATRRHLDG